MNGEQYVPWDKRARYHFFPRCTVHKKVIIFSQKLFGNAVLHGSTHRKRFSAVKPLAEKWYQGTLLASLGATHVPGQMQVRVFLATQWPHVWVTWKTDLTWRSWRLWREWMFVRCPGAFKSVRTPTDDATALSSRRRRDPKPQICRSSGLTLKHWLRRFPSSRGIAASASRISLVSLVLVVLISDSEIRFIFLVFQVLGAWPPVSCAAFYWCRTSSGRPSVQLLSWRFIVQLMDFVHRRLIWIIWTL